MAARPASTSFLRQDLIVAVAMLGLLAGSAFAAQRLVVSRAPAAPVVRMNEVRADDLLFNLPASWQRVQTPPGRRSAVVAWVDADRPSRRLGLIRVTVARGVQPPIVIQRFLPLFMGQAAARGVQTFRLDDFPHPGLRVVEWAGASKDDDDDTRLHLAADLTADGGTHYLFYLTDEADPGEDPRAVYGRSLDLLRGVHQSARIDTSTAAASDHADSTDASRGTP